MFSDAQDAIANSRFCIFVCAAYTQTENWLTPVDSTFLGVGGLAGRVVSAASAESGAQQPEPAAPPSLGHMAGTQGRLGDTWSPTRKVHARSVRSQLSILLYTMREVARGSILLHHAAKLRFDGSHCDDVAQ